MLLNAGPIAVLYENGFLRYVNLGQDEVLRRIYVALRNQDWDTAQLMFSGEIIDQQAESFRIDYDWAADDLGMQMKGHITMEGASDGTITVSWYGKALNTFLRNRVGFCVLHPIHGVAGQPCYIEGPDGSKSTGTFPVMIKPDQPFVNIQSMRWQTTAGHELQLDFTGDIFETEDQRNWSDTSYKTYCTPLERPKPVQVEAGTELKQQVVFRPLRIADAPSIPDQTPVDSEAPKLKTIGLGHCADGPTLTDEQASLLRDVGFSHLRADVFLTDPDWQSSFSRAITDAQLLAVPMELVLFFGAKPAQELPGIIECLKENAVKLRSITLLQAENRLTTNALLMKTVPVLRAQFPKALLGGGTDANFADINRNYFDYDLVDFITYSINPQAHAFDNLTILENIDAQADTVQSARALSGGKPVHVSVITLRSRFNPDAKISVTPAIPPVDPRQKTDFAAEWLRGSLNTLAKAGTESVTYFETHGPRGILDEQGPFPVYTVFADYLSGK